MNVRWLRNENRREGKLQIVPDIDDPDTTAVVDQIVQTRKRAAQLEKDLQRADATIAELARENEFLRDKLREATGDRDFYHARYVASHTRLSDVAQTILHGMEADSREAASIGIKSHLQPTDKEKVLHKLAESLDQSSEQEHSEPQAKAE